MKYIPIRVTNSLESTHMMQKLHDAEVARISERLEFCYICKSKPTVPSSSIQWIELTSSLNSRNNDYLYVLYKDNRQSLI